MTDFKETIMNGQVCEY